MLLVVISQFFEHLGFGLFLLFFHDGEFAFQISKAGAYSGYGFLADGEVFVFVYGRVGGFCRWLGRLESGERVVAAHGAHAQDIGGSSKVIIIWHRND